MKENTIKINEAQLKKIVAESVKKVLKERTLSMNTIGIVSGLLEIKKISEFLLNKYETIDSSEDIDTTYNTVHDCVNQLDGIAQNFGYR